MTKEELAAYAKVLKACEPQVIKLAQAAVKQDHWMVPTADKINLPYPEYAQALINGWLETDQFNIRWRSRINELVVRELDNSEIFNGQDGEIRISLSCELVDTFWQVWVDGQKRLNAGKSTSRRKRGPRHERHDQETNQRRGPAKNFFAALA